MIQTRKRFQRGSLKKVGRQWIAQRREDGHRRKARWPISGMNKSEAEAKLAGILGALDGCRTTGKPKPTFAGFVERTYLPFYRGKWKASTAGDNEGRLKSSQLGIGITRRGHVQSRRIAATSEPKSG